MLRLDPDLAQRCHRHGLSFFERNLSNLCGKRERRLAERLTAGHHSAWSYSVGFTIPLVQDNNPDFDRTGTLSVHSDWAPLSIPPPSPSRTTTPRSACCPGHYAGGNSYSNISILEGGISNANQATVVFFREHNGQARTINYTLPGNAVAGTDYAPAIGTITIPDSAYYATATIYANNTLQTTNKNLSVQVTNGIYALWSGETNATITILPDYPTLSIVASPTTILDGAADGSGSSTFTIYRDTTNAYDVSRPAFSVGGTAVNGSDYSPHLSSTSVTLPAGGTAWTNITITALENNQQTTKTATLS